MKVETKTLEGLMLDYFVAKVLKLNPKIVQLNPHNKSAGYAVDIGEGPIYFSPSTIWAQGGIIIDENDISLTPIYKGDTIPLWESELHRPYVSPGQSIGPTKLIAAMRCLVSSFKGPFIDVPTEVLEIFYGDHSQVG